MARTIKKSSAASNLGIVISHPDRALWPGVTKLALAHYYEAFAPFLLPHLKGRPLTMVRCPSGIGGQCFFMKHAQPGMGKELLRHHIQEKNKEGDYLVAESAAGLAALAQMNVLELHTWNSTIADLERPDRIVIDLDPGPETGWADVVRASRLVRDGFTALKLQSFVKTTGGRGLHVVVPTKPALGWDDCLEFSRRFATTIAEDAPRKYTTAFAKAGREDKILIDYLRNNRGSTSVSAYSPRAREGATVSLPLSWDELSPRVPPQRFTIATVSKRMLQEADDAWRDYWTCKQQIPAPSA